MNRYRIVALHRRDARLGRGGATARPVDGRGWSSIIIPPLDAAQLGLRVGDEVLCEVNHSGWATAVERP